MAGLFLTGPLARPSLLGSVLGVDAPPLTMPAHLPEHAILAAPDRCFDLWLTSGQGAADGAFWDAPSTEMHARIAYLATAVGLIPREVRVETAQGPRDAVVYAGPPPAPENAGPWRAAEWESRLAGLARMAAAEIMSRRGAESAEALVPRLPMILARAGARIAAQDAAPATLRSRMSASDVEETALVTRHSGFFVTQEIRLRHLQYDGTISPELNREVFVCSDAAIVLPYDPVRDRVCLIEQFRMGPYGRGDPLPWVLEPVAGRIDGGETPEATAHRECAEEAGLRLRGLEHINSHYCSPGSVTEFFHCYLGLCDLPDMASGRGGLETENEDIRTHVLSFDRAMELCGTNEINVGPLVLMLYWLQRERPRLRAAA